MGVRRPGRWRLFPGAIAGAVLVSACSLGGPGSDPEPSPSAEPPLVAVTTDLPRATPLSQGLDPRGLREAAEVAERAGSSCFTVLRRGEVVGEWNWDTEPDAPREVFSITKSVTSALVGIAARDGDLRLGDKVSRYVPQWRGTPSAEVTVRHLLSNTSGRFWSLQSDYNKLVNAPSRTSYAVGLRQQFPPGTSWQYNNAAIQVLEAVLEEATGTPVDEFADERLFDPLGMADTRMNTDRTGGASTFFGLQTTCLDVARFGLLYLGKGAFEGERILSRSYVAASVGRSSTELNAAYGLLWWVNRPGEIRGATDELDATGQPTQPRREGRLLPRAPARAFAALGLGGQVLLVDPATSTIVVRLGPFGSGEEEYTLADAATVLSAVKR